MYVCMYLFISLSLSLPLSLYPSIYLYVYTHADTHICIYIGERRLRLRKLRLSHCGTPTLIASRRLGRLPVG